MPVSSCCRPSCHSLSPLRGAEGHLGVRPPSTGELDKRTVAGVGEGTYRGAMLRPLFLMYIFVVVGQHRSQLAPAGGVRKQGPSIWLPGAGVVGCQHTHSAGRLLHASGASSIPVA
jgi:hypothetical protein